MVEIGIVKFFNIDKGFGFIKFDKGGVDIFVYIFVVQVFGFNGLIENQKVFFDIELDCCGKGLKVVNLMVIG